MIRSVIQDKELAAHLEGLPDDVREVYLMADNEIRLSAVNATKMVAQMAANHKTGILETYMLGQGYLAGALLSAEVKGNDRIQLTIECGGPVKGMTIEAWACGAVRGYLQQNPIPLEKPLTSLDTNEVYGPGFLTITKILEGSKTPVSGQVMMEYGNLAQDLALYYQQSEQTPSLFSLSVKFDKMGRVWGAGGLFLQALPQCPETTLDKLQEKASKLSSLGSFLAEGGTIRDYVDKEFADYGVVHLDRAPIGFSCPCSEKKFRGYLTNLPQKEKDAILKGEFPLVLKCFNCGTEYSYSKSDLETLFSEAQ